MENLKFFTPLYSESNICVTDRELNVNGCGISTIDRFTNATSTERTLNSYYLMYLTHGELDITLEGKRSIFKSGSFVIIPPGCSHKYVRRPGIKETVHYSLLFSGSKAKQLLEDLNLPEKVITDITVKDDILRAFNRLFEDFIHIDSYFEISSTALTTSLLTRFARAISKYGNISNKGHALSRVLTYLNRHYDEDISMKELAASINISYGHFRRLFKESTGMSPIEYLTKIRLDKACMMLNRYEISIKEVAIKSGFSDQAYFTRVFTKHFKITPSKYQALKAKEIF